MLVIGEFCDKEHSLVEVNEGSTDETFCLGYLERNGEEGLVYFGIFVYVHLFLINLN